MRGQINARSNILKLSISMIEGLHRILLNIDSIISDAQQNILRFSDPLISYIQWLLLKKSFCLYIINWSFNIPLRSLRPTLLRLQIRRLLQVQNDILIINNFGLLKNFALDYSWHFFIAFSVNTSIKIFVSAFNIIFGDVV